MKLLVRIVGITVMGIIVSVGVIYLVNTNIIINELNECSSLAMKQTQIAIENSIKDKLDLIDNNDFDDDKYEEYYKHCFLSAVNDDSLYLLDIDCDADKGIMYVKIDVPSYKYVPTKELLSFIDIKGEGLDDLESLQYDVNSKVTKIKATGGIRGTKAGIVKSLPDNPDGKMRAYEYNVNIAATESARPTTSNSAGPYIEIRCTDEDDNVNVINSGRGGDKAFTNLKSEEKCYCKLFEIVMPNDIKDKEFTVQINSVTLERTSTISEYLESKVKKTDLHLSEDVDIDYRYIDDINSLDSNSIWLQNKEYKNELERYLGYMQ